jgi:hypothetical protein
VRGSGLQASDTASGGARFQTQGGLTKKFLAAQHINCQLTIEIEELNKKNLSGLRRLIVIKELIISSSFTLKNISLNESDQTII